MRLMSMRCPACGGAINNKITGRIVTCEYCDSRFMLDEDDALALADTLSSEPGGDDAGGSLDMPSFAAEACQAFLARRGKGDSFASSEKIIRGLSISPTDEVLLIHDDTMFKSGKNGFAVTDRGIYCRNLGEDASFIDWDTFAMLDEPARDGCHIQCGSRLVCYFTDDNNLMPELLSFYRKLHAHAKRTA